MSEYSAQRASLGSVWPLQWGARTHIMAILNITPDSFSGDGLGTEPDVVTAAIGRARQAISDGAHVLDVGGVASSAGLSGVSEDLELERVLPVIRALAREVTTPISIDSCRAGVVEAALDAGATIVNSNWGIRSPDGEWNEPLAKVIAARRAPAVLTHNRPAAGTAAGHRDERPGRDPLDLILDELAEEIEYANTVGVQSAQLVIDPGFGQGKTPAEDHMLLADLGRFRQIGLPLLIGGSRKRVVSSIVGVPPAQCDAATTAITALAAAAGVDIVRVHNVRPNSDVARVIDTVHRPQPAR